MSVNKTTSYAGNNIYKTSSQPDRQLIVLLRPPSQVGFQAFRLSDMSVNKITSFTGHNTFQTCQLIRLLATQKKIHPRQAVSQTLSA